MRRNAPTGSTSLDQEIREAAEAAARRSGLSLEAWLAAAEAAPSRRAPAKRRRSAERAVAGAAARTDSPSRALAPESPPFAARTAEPARTAPMAPPGGPARPAAAGPLSDAAAVLGTPASGSPAVQTVAALDSVAEWLERSDERMAQSARDTVARQERLASAVAEALAAVRQRLDGIERRAAEAREPALAPVLSEAMATLRSDVARLSARFDASNPTGSAVADLVRDLGGVRAGLESVATREEVSSVQRQVRSLGDEIGALERQIRGLAEDVQRAPTSDQVTAVLGSVAGLQGELQVVAADLQDGLHRRITAEVNGLAAKIDRIAEDGQGRAAVEALGRQIDDMRQILARRAGHEQVDRLATELGLLRRHLADMELEQVRRSDLAAIGEVLNDLRAATRRAEDAAQASAVPDELQGISRRLDVLLDRQDPPGLARLDRRVADLADHVAGLAAGGAGSAAPLAARIDERFAALDRRIAGLGLEIAEPAEHLSQRLDERLADLAEHLEGVANASVRPVQDVTEQIGRRLTALDERLASLGAEMRQPLEGLAGRLDEAMGGRARPFDALADRLDQRLAEITGPVQDLASRVSAGLADLAQPIETLTGRVDHGLGEIDRHLRALAKDHARASDALAERLSQHLAGLTTHLTSLNVDGAKPARAVAERVERLSGQVSALALQVGTGSEPMADRLGRLEESVRAVSAGTAPLIERLDRVADQLQGAGPQPLLDRFDRLAEQVERVATPAPLLDRLERLEDGIRDLGERADTAPLELMVRSLHERLDGVAAGTGLIDGIEERLTGLFDRLGLTAAEPVQQAISDTLTHVRGLRGEAAIIAERAARAVLRDVPVASAAELETVRQGFEELKALQAAADKKTQAAIKAVHNALETLVMRMPPGPPATLPAPLPAPDIPATRLESAVRRLHAAAMAQTEEVIASANPGLEPDEILLDPATPRAAAGKPAAVAASQEGEPGTVRASFIAAARRAAQAAAAEAALADSDSAAQATEAADKSPISNQTLIERIRQTFEGQRRPLLVSLALLIVAAGSAQVTGAFRGGPAPHLPAPQAGEPAAAAPAVAEPAPTAPAAQAEAADRAPQPTPDSTGSLVAPAPTAPADAPRPADPGLSALPEAVPASLRAAALAGDPPALFELATRFAESRGLPRDLALAAKLFDRAAQAGLAPAQFHLGNLHEKGAGVPRDLALARTWYERAAAAGNTRAMHNLGVLLAEGIEGKPDYAAATRWFWEASEHGVRDSQYNLGVLLARGLGTRQDLGQSYKWFALAAADGDEDAGKKRDEVAGRLSPADLAAAKAQVAGWRPRPAHPAANQVPPAPQGWTAAPARAMSRRS